MDDRQRLFLASRLVDCDATEDLSLWVARFKLATDRERAADQVLRQLFRLLHPLFSDCKHPEWDAENERLFAEHAAEYETWRARYENLHADEPECFREEEEPNAS